MIKQSKDYIHQHGITISTTSTTKTKCMCFRPNTDMVKKVLVSGNEMNWMEQNVHLGITK